MPVLGIAKVNNGQINVDNRLSTSTARPASQASVSIEVGNRVVDAGQYRKGLISVNTGAKYVVLDWQAPEVSWRTRASRWDHRLSPCTMLLAGRQNERTYV
jgi:hypothetical protein